MQTKEDQYRDLLYSTLGFLLGLIFGGIIMWLIVKNIAVLVGGI